METDVFLWHSLIYCILFILALVPIALVNPRMMLHSYPREIQKAVPPKTKEEKKQNVIFATPIMLVMLGYPMIVTWYYRPEAATFYYFFAEIWGMMMVFNVFDLLILDWVMFCAITPGFIVIKGTAGNPGYKNYRFHFIGFLKGIVITAVISGALAGIMSLI